MDLSKAYDCISHELLIAKLYLYGETRSSLKLILNYLSGCKQRIKIGLSVSAWCGIITEVPQRSTIGPLVFIIFINDLFLFIKWSHERNFSDGNTLYYCNKNLFVMFRDLVYDLQNVLNWFTINSIKANPKKVQFMVLEEVYPIRMF